MLDLAGLDHEGDRNIVCYEPSITVLRPSWHAGVCGEVGMRGNLKLR
jgi:hypothetical protein